MSYSVTHKTQMTEEIRRELGSVMKQATAHLLKHYED